MIYNIREAFNELLEENDWMDGQTKQVARDKANAMNERIGYPDLLTNSIELSKEYGQVGYYESGWCRVKSALAHPFHCPIDL